MWGYDDVAAAVRLGEARAAVAARRARAIAGCASGSGELLAVDPDAAEVVVDGPADVDQLESLDRA